MPTPQDSQAPHPDDVDRSQPGEPGSEPVAPTSRPARQEDSDDGAASNQEAPRDTASGRVPQSAAQSGVTSDQVPDEAVRSSAAGEPDEPADVPSSTPDAPPSAALDSASAEGPDVSPEPGAEPSAHSRATSAADTKSDADPSGRFGVPWDDEDGGGTIFEPLQATGVATDQDAVEPAGGTEGRKQGPPVFSPSPDDADTLQMEAIRPLPPERREPVSDDGQTVLAPRPDRSGAGSAPDDGQTVLAPRPGIAAGGSAPDDGRTVLAPRPDRSGGGPAPDNGQTVLAPRPGSDEGEIGDGRAKWEPRDKRRDESATGDTVLAPRPGERSDEPDTGRTVLASRPGERSPEPDTSRTILAARPGDRSDQPDDGGTVLEPRPGRSAGTSADGTVLAPRPDRSVGTADNEGTVLAPSGDSSARGPARRASEPDDAASQDRWVPPETSIIERGAREAPAGDEPQPWWQSGAPEPSWRTAESGSGVWGPQPGAETSMASAPPASQPGASGPVGDRFAPPPEAKPNQGLLSRLPTWLLAVIGVVVLGLIIAIIAVVVNMGAKDKPAPPASASSFPSRAATPSISLPPAPGQALAVDATKINFPAQADSAYPTLIGAKTPPTDARRAQYRSKDGTDYLTLDVYEGATMNVTKRSQAFIPKSIKDQGTYRCGKLAEDKTPVCVGDVPGGMIEVSGSADTIQDAVVEQAFTEWVKASK